MGMGFRAVVVTVAVAMSFGCGGDDGTYFDDGAGADVPAPQGGEDGTGGREAGTGGRGFDTLFNRATNLPAYPRAIDVRMTADGRDSEVLFRSTDSVSDIFAFYDTALVRNGWARTEIDRTSDQMEAHYRLGRDVVKMRVERERDFFRFTLDFGADNRDERSARDAREDSGRIGAPN